MESFKNTFFLKNKFQNIFDTIVKLEDFFFNEVDIGLKNPIFITGMPRSGTTLLTHILYDTERFGSKDSCLQAEQEVKMLTNSKAKTKCVVAGAPIR